MCSCTHGSDRHYLDYAGPGVAGGILTRCLEPGCGCQMFTPTSVIVTPVTLIFRNGNTLDRIGEV
jgi:hypothetical protein